MTDRAVRGVGIDWQVQVQPGTTSQAVLDAVHATKSVMASTVVDFGTSTGLSTTTGGSTQSTGAAVVLGVPGDYRSLFPSELRTLAGSNTGVLLAQQTAANLHAAPGDRVKIALTGHSPAMVTVAGVVDLPKADSLFQKVGAPVGAQRTAPPDNVLILPAAQWHQVFDPIAITRPDQVSSQIHIRLDHNFPTAPADAYTAVVAAAHNFEAVTAGAAVVGNNLGAALDAARSDAAYAQALFGFLGLPGAVLAALLTSTIASAGSTRRRAEQSLLRTRGATAAQLLRCAAVEAAVTGAVGALVGLCAAAVVGRIAFGTASFGTTAGAATIWAATSAAIGLAIAAATILLPARRDLRAGTIIAGRAPIGRPTYPAWARYGLDAVLLMLAGLVFTATSSHGYQLVLATEGAPTIAVSYWALAGPALLWIGAGLLIWRLTDLLLGRGRPWLRRSLRPVTGSLAQPIAAGISRQRRPITRAIVLLACAIAFAASTATFNATYAQQAEADAQLSNGADVTVVHPPGAPVPAGKLAAIGAIPGVRAVEPVAHRFAYIGTDLQDLYGIRPASITQATALQDSYFSGGTAAGLMTTLTARTDSILVSAETVKDYQLHVGDLINLRLVDGRTHQRITVPFHYVGVVSEFPTAPKDSFFVANAAYLAQRTGNGSAATLLVDTGGRNTTSAATAIKSLLGPTATVTDITTTRATIGSSLTAVDLTGLTRVELTFALILAAAAGGLVLGLGLAERRRTFAIATALGARRRQLRAMIGSEAGVLAVLGLIAGAVTGTVLSVMLVKVLSGVFDPPPSTIPIPLLYLGAVAGVAVLGLIVVTAATTRTASRPAVGVLREL